MTTGLALLLNADHIVGRPLPVLPRLIHEGCAYQFRWLELTDREPIEPRLLATGQAVDLRASDVPQLDIHAV